MKCKHLEVTWDSNDAEFYCLNCGRNIKKVYPNIVLHIGLHKTGTTFLQKEVFPKILNANLLVNKYQVCQLFIDNDKLNIISGEGFSLSMAHWGYTESQRYETLDHLKKLFPTAKIIVGVRNKESWLKSCYAQYIKTGGTKNLEEYFKSFTQDSIDMDRYIREVKKRWKFVYVYHQETLNDSVVKILNFIGIIDSDLKIDYKNRQNVSLSKTQLKIFRMLNKIHPMVAHHIQIAIGVVKR